MIHKIRKRIDRELANFISSIDKLYSLRKVSPLFSKSIKDFVLRKGKRVRSILFVIGYLGFAKRIAKNLYKSAISIELLHAFLLVHDDIIDRSSLRRNKPSMHKIFDNYLKKYKGIRFNGQDLALIAGDALNSFAMSAFLSIKVSKKFKEEALKRFIDAAIYTEIGEFIELIQGIKRLENTTKNDIYKIYDFKTAHYTFASPLSIGATLAGAGKNEINILTRYGLTLGRAFQIKDDILGIFGEERKIGKSSLTDLKQAKKTILIWCAYNHSNRKDKKTIKRILSKENINKGDLSKMRKIIIISGSLDYAKKEILHLSKTAQILITSSKMRPRYKDALSIYCNNLLSF